MSTAKIAEEYVVRYFKNKKKIVLKKKSKGERGFDFKSANSKTYVEVKGTTARSLSEVLFRYFTNAEHEKAKECIRNKKGYEIHLVLGIGRKTREHYCITAKELINYARPEVIWSLPITRKLKLTPISKKRIQRS